MPNNVRIGVSAPGAKQASSEMDQLRDKFTKLRAEGGKGIAIGAGAAATAKAFDLVGSAINGVVGFLGDASTAAREDEESQTRLRASLQANIDGWDGNTEAIEKVIAARMQLGFTDEEQRTSLAILVAATHDYNKALEVQRTAMDLARLKGISLAEASEALTKVEAGQYRALKSLGIVLKEGATAQDALTAVQKVATGQADAFAATNEGKLLVSQIKLSEAMEKLGYVIMPALADAAVGVSNVIEFLANNMNVVTPILLGLGAVLTTVAIPALVGFAVAAAAAAVAAAPILLVGAALAGVGLLLKAGWDMATKASDASTEALDKTAQAASDAGVAYSKTAEGMADDARESAHLTGQANLAIGESISAIGAYGKDAAGEVSESYKKMEAASDGLVDKLIADKESLLHNYYDVLVTEDDLLANKAEIAAQRRILASKTATDKEKQDARAALHQLSGDRIKYLEDLATAGKTNTKAFKEGMAGLLADLKHAHGEERTAILAEIRALELLATKARIAKIGFNNLAGIGVSGSRASGGPVKANHAYLVNENTPRSEIFVPNEDGSILPTMDKLTGAAAGGSGGGGTSSVTFAPTVVIQGFATPATKQAIITELGPLFAQWLRSQGWRPT